MGNVFRKKKVAAEELETLSAQVKSFRADIENTFLRRRSILYYLTLVVFIIATSLTAYIIVTFSKREHQIVFSLAALTGAVFVLYLLRRFVNVYYSYAVDRKQRNLDEAVEKKRQILENIKETETFKVAKELLEKYDDEVHASIEQGSPKQHVRGPPSTQQRHPHITDDVTSTVRRSSLPVPPSRLAEQTPAGRNAPPLPPTALRRGPPLPPGSAMVLPTPMSGMPPPRRPPGPPVRPFVREGKTTLDKVIDYFFGDGPNNRFALICSNCHAHNGMALPGEFEYLAFACFNCGQFNPAKKLRPSMLQRGPGGGVLPDGSRPQPEHRGAALRIDEGQTSRDPSSERPPSSTSQVSLPPQGADDAERNSTGTEDDDFVAVDKENVPPVAN